MALDYFSDRPKRAALELCDRGLEPEPKLRRTEDRLSLENDPAAGLSHQHPVAAPDPPLHLTLSCEEEFRFRNITHELRTARREPRMTAAKLAVDSAYTALQEIVDEWEKQTQCLAVGGQTALDVEARRKALARAEHKFDASRVALESEQSGQMPSEGLGRISTRCEQLARCVDRERKGLELAERLAALSKRRQESEDNVHRTLGDLRLESTTVCALTKEFRDAEVLVQKLPSPVTVFRASPDLELVESLAKAEEHVRSELCVPVLLSDKVLHAVNLCGIAKACELATEQEEDDAPSLIEVEVPGTPTKVHGYMLVSPKEGEHLKTFVQTGDKPRCLQLLQAWLGLLPGFRVENLVAATLTRLLRPRNADPPAELGKVFRHYQLAGFRWLASNAMNGIGSLLADDMGLGKTLQAIALLLHLRAQGFTRPALVVTPLSVLGNWTVELSRWAPHLRFHVYHQQGRTSSLLEQTGTIDVVLTTYAILQRDVDFLCGQRFDAMIIDEGQVIKNAASKTSQAVKRVAAEGLSAVRVALSGTPVENRLAELHSILEFTVPGYLGAQAWFEQEFARPMERTDSDEANRAVVSARLAHATRPFLLRRCKNDPSVSADLPSKIEVVHQVQLTAPQRRLYERVQASRVSQAAERIPSPSVPGAPESDRPRKWSVLTPLRSEGDIPCSSASSQLCSSAVNDPDRDEVSNDIDTYAAETVLEEPRSSKQLATVPTRRSNQVMAMLHALQQVCNHPVAVTDARWCSVERDAFDATPKHSGKMTRLLELLEEVLEPPREKAVVFTQYLRSLDLLQATVQEFHPDVEVLALKGSLSRDERDNIVCRFQEDPVCAVLVCTLGVGGVGINLTAATHVFHFDRCWNPAREAQATDRAHRIGQSQAVMVHRLITVGTFEERLARVMDRKSSLAKEVMPRRDIATVIAEYSQDELLELFTFRSTQVGED